jgi:hypothetical protein
MIPMRLITIGKPQDDKPSCKSPLKRGAVNLVANFCFRDGKVRFHPPSTTDYVIYRVLDLGRARGLFGTSPCVRQPIRDRPEA